MKQFPFIEKLDTGILFTLELVSSLSVLLLAFGLIASMANVLTEGSILTHNVIMQRVWAWTQCVAIDANVAGTIIRTFRFATDGEKVKAWLYGGLSALLLFTAAIVSNIESVQQTLNLTLNQAYVHVFIPVEALIWIRSLAIVLLIVAHAMRHVQVQKQALSVKEQQGQAISTVVTPELVQQLRLLLIETTVSGNKGETQETHQVTETTTLATVPDDGSIPSLESLLLRVTEEERNSVLEAYKKGIRRREICRYLHWGSAKYRTIVKPVLDAYEKQ